MTRCVSYSVRALISRQSRKLASLGQCALWRQLAQTSLRKPRYRHGLSSGRKRLGVASYEGAEYILTVREAGEHFCELIGQEITVQ